jgi:hypothetical protein
VVKCETCNLNNMAYRDAKHADFIRAELGFRKLTKGYG